MLCLHSFFLFQYDILTPLQILELNISLHFAGAPAGSSSSVRKVQCKSTYSVHPIYKLLVPRATDDKPCDAAEECCVRAPVTHNLA